MQIGPVLEDEFYSYPSLFLLLSLFHRWWMADSDCKPLCPCFLRKHAPIIIIFALAKRYCEL